MGGGSFGKVLILSFRDNEEYIINRILSCMNGETEILHQGDVQNGQLHFEGLYIAEVEFPDEESAQAYLPPLWLGKEVTQENTYHNSTLSKMDKESIQNLVSSL